MTKLGICSSLFGLWPMLAAASTVVPTYGTYFGGTGDTNVGVAVTVDPSGNVIIAGYTTSLTLPGTANAFQRTKATGFPDNIDVFIAKFDPTGRTLLWTTFLGGDGNDYPVALAADSSGNIYVTGTTTSSKFPGSASISCTPPPGDLQFSVPFQQQCSMNSASSANGAFLLKISSDGSTLMYSVGLTGSQPTALAVTSQGEAYVSTVGSGQYGLFLFRINTTGTALIYGTFLGGGLGGASANIASLAVDASGNCYLGGSAIGNIPTTANALQNANSNENLTPNLGNGFVLEVNPSGSQLVYGTWFGPAYYATTVTNIGLNGDGSLYFAGYTTATTFQTTRGAYQPAPGSGFVAELTPGSTVLTAFSYLTHWPAAACYEYGVCDSGAMVISDVSHTAYFLLGPEALGSQFLELNLPNLGASSSTPSFTVGSQTGFAPISLALASPSSIWAVGGCSSCALGNLVSGNAFQTTPQNANSSAVLFQLTDLLTCAITGDGMASIVDAQLIINEALGVAPAFDDLNGDGEINVVDIQIVMDAAIGLGCSAGVETGTTSLPTITAVLNAASLRSGPISPGEVVTLAGTGLGLATPAAGRVQALFNGRPAPLAYVSATQINCVVPYEIPGKGDTYVEVRYHGQTSRAFPVGSTSANPGIFTANGSGTGPAAAFNQDLAYNSPNNPAAKGSTVVLFMTGEGQTSPPGLTGKVTTVAATALLTPQPLLPVSVLINNQPATVVSYGEAPDLVSGVMQLSVRIPANVPSGNLPISVSVGGNYSPNGVTISVR